MSGKFKVLGLALGTVFAFGAMTAPAAIAGEFTSDGSVTVEGTGTYETLIFEPGQTFECTSSNRTLGPQNTTPWGLFNPGTGITTLTDRAHYSDCVTTIGNNSLALKVTTNGCDFLMHIGETTADSSYGVTTDVVCGAGESIEIHVYSTGISVCTYKIGPQTGLNGPDIKNVTGGTLQVSGEITNLAVARTGVFCGGTKETKKMVLLPNYVVNGKNATGAATELKISD